MIMKRIDDLGRVFIPRDIRKSLRLSEGDIVDISVLDNKLILTKHFDNTIDELLSLIPAVEQEELRNKLYEVFDEWNNSYKEDDNGTREKL